MYANDRILNMAISNVAQRARYIDDRTINANSIIFQKDSNGVGLRQNRQEPYDYSRKSFMIIVV